MTKAIYAFSGDPITYGHIDVVERAAGIFDDLTVAIGINPDKKYTFSLEEREEMARRVLSRFPNVKVVSFKGLLVDYAYENNIPVIVKGIRNEADLDYETILHKTGDSQRLGIETLFLPAAEGKSHISSSMVKAIQKEQGLVQDFVPLLVKQKLEEKISNQYIVGVTGEIAVGKSYTANELVKLAREKGIQAINIELDELGHEILEISNEPLYRKVREAIIQHFGEEVKKADGFIDRNKLGRIVFESKTELDKLNSLLHPAILMRLRRELYGKQGLIFITAALFAEVDILYLCNNNVVLVKTDEALQKERLKERGFNDDQIERRLNSQFTTELKEESIRERIKKDDYGKLWMVEKNSEANFDDTLEALLEHYNLK